MTKKQKNKEQLVSFMGVIVYTIVFVMIVIFSIRNSKKAEEPGYVMFPSDKEIEQIELGLKPTEHEI